VLVLAAGAAIALVAGNAVTANEPVPDTQPAASEVRGGVAGSTVWFCPGLPATVAVGEKRLSLANLDDREADVVVTVVPDDGAPVRRELHVGPAAVESVARADLGPAGALTVESFGARVVVEEGAAGEAGTEMTPCATQSATEWHFAAGTTVRGVQQWLVVLNPYASDAKVDIALRTSDGVRRSDPLQGFDIPRRSRAVIPVHDYAVRNARVAVEVRARSGRVVAAQTLVYSTAAGVPGLASSLGAIVATDHWLFAAAPSSDDLVSWVAIANDGVDDAHVTVQARPQRGDAPDPAVLTVARDGVEWVRLGGCSGDDPCLAVTPGNGYGIDVRADRGVPVVAQTLTRATASAGDGGAATAMGVTQPETRWAFAVSRVPAPSTSTVVALVNPFAGEARASIALVRDGAVETPERLREIVLPPGRRVSVAIPGSGRGGTDAALLIDATGGVVVERMLMGEGDFGLSPGIVRP
jgi:hypothetical protein